MTAPNPRIFISYRADEATDAAQRLYDTLVGRFGDRAFLDTSDIRGGEEWRDRIQSELDRATCVLVLIGSRWADIRDEFGTRRLDLASDWVRREIEHAIENRKATIPVLLNAASMPTADRLPGSIRPLADKQAVSLRSVSWHGDSESLIELLVSSYGFHGLKENLQISSEARQLAEFLSSNSENAMENDPLVSASNAQVALGFADDTLGAAGSELEDQGWVILHRDSSMRARVGFSQIGARASLFTDTDALFCEWDPQVDALAVARALISVEESDEEVGLSMHELANRYGWEPRRMNPAAYQLVGDDLVEACEGYSNSPFFFSALYPTPKTTRFIRNVGTGFGE